MDTTTQRKYDNYLTNVRVSKGMIETAKYKGREEGREEGHKEGRKKEKLLTILRPYDMEKNVSFIAKVAEMKEAEVVEVLREHKGIK